MLDRFAGMLNRVFRGTTDTRVRAIFRGTVPFTVGFLVTVVGFVALRTIGLPLLRDLLSGVGSAGDLLVSGTIRVFTLAVALAVALRLDRRRVTDFGITASRESVANLLGGVAIGVTMAAIPLAFALQNGTATITDTLAVRVTGYFLLASGILFALFGFATNVVYEEVVFRAIMLQNFAEGLTERSLSPVSALLVALAASSILFGCSHIIFAGGGATPGRTLSLAITSTILGLVWGFAYLLTGSLSLPVGIHFGYNVTHGMVFGITGAALKLPTVLVTQTPPVLSGVEYTAFRAFVGIIALIGWVYLTEHTLSPQTDLTRRTTNQ